MIEPQTSVSHPSRDEFAALLEESLSGTALQEGSVVKGTIVAIEKDVAVIDVGLKTEGRIPLKEFGVSGRAHDMTVGDKVEVYLERVENALGEAVLSREKARREESWTRLEEKYKANERVEGVIFNRVKGGFTVDLDGAVAFLPGSQVDIRPMRDIGPLMHVPQPFQILKMDRRRGNIVVSRRSVLEETRAEQRTEIVARLEEGQVIDGVVKNITDYGAFIDLGGIDGLLARHRHGLAARQSSERDRQCRRYREGADHPHQPGDPAHQPRHEAAAGRSVAGHRRQISGRLPLQGHGHQHHRLWRLRGARARRRRPDPRLRDELDQEEHPSRQDRLDQPAGRSAGARGRSRQASHLARPEADPGQSVGRIRRQPPDGHRIEGQIRNITEFGLFIGLDGGIDGMVHLSDLDWTKPGEEAIKDYKKGDTVKAVVLDVDAEKERISLGIKQLSADPLASGGPPPS